MNVDHPDSDTLLAFREHRLTGAVVREVALHLGVCDRCAQVEPADMRTLFDALVPHSGVRRLAAAFESGSKLPHSMAIAAAIVFAVLAITAIALLLRQPAAPVTTVSNPPAPVVVPAPAPRVVATLADGTGQIALLEDGTISGVDVHSPRDAEDARAALSGHPIAIPTFIAAMPGAVRGGASAHPLRAVAPFRSAVLEPRPRFSWTPVRGARNYRVAVFDADYEEIAQSEPLTGTSWTPSEPLPAGADLSWHVVADTDSGEISSAGSDRGEAVFRVLAPKEAAEVELGKEQYRGSALLRGLLYSRHGLLHDAEREFRTLAEQNPSSPVAKALVGSVRR